jgi:hypothetical protein
MLLSAMPSLQRARHYSFRRHSQTTWPLAICYRSPRTKVLMIRRLSTAMRATTSDKRALTGVLAVWAGMLSVVLGCIAIYGRNLPLSEDWNMVPALTGHQPDSLEWLWEQNNEHRLPFQKAIYLILLKASGGDFRIGMIANTLILGGLSLAMILTARHLRGRTQLADAFFPLALLHLGHSNNLLIGWQIQFVVSTALICGWLLIIVRECWPLSPNITVIAGLILVLLPISGANGLLFTPFAVLWLAAGVLLYQRDTCPRWIVPFQGACMSTSVALAGLYFVGYVPFFTPPNPGFGATMVTGVRFVGMGIGPIGAGNASAQLIPGLLPKLITGGLFCGATLLLLASSVIPLRRGLCDIRTPEGSRFFGFLTFIAATAVLAVAVAWGRAGWVPEFSMPDRYVLLSVPALCAAYFAWLLYGPKGTGDRIAKAFAIAALLALPFNVREGLAGLDWYVTGMQAFEQDLADGLSWQEIGDKNEPFLAHGDGPILVERMRMLHDAKIGPLGRATPR